MFQVLRDFVKVFTWEEPEMSDWINFELGEGWDEGKLYLRISAIHAVLGSTEHSGESVVHISDNAFHVVGTPEEIMEMINARTGT